MIAVRYKNSGATYQHLEALCNLIADPACKAVRLFATEYDKANTNSPSVAAVATYPIPGITDVHVVFDGDFLTVRLPRYGEVRALMDAAQNSDKVTFCANPVRNTSLDDPTDAVAYLLGEQSSVSFTAETRPKYFRMLSSMTEKEIQEHLQKL